MNTLQLVLLLLGASVLVVTACRIANLPPILGYLLVGVVVAWRVVRARAALASSDDSSVEEDAPR